MRALILIAVAALPIAACNKSGPVDNAANAADGLSAESITANDITAIDAVTGADANMAADVNYLPSVDNDTDSNGNASGAQHRQQAKTSSENSAATSAPATQNTTAPSTATANNAT
jgi:hypothetical protein